MSILFKKRQQTIDSQINSLKDKGATIKYSDDGSTYQIIDKSGNVMSFSGSGGDIGGIASDAGMLPGRKRLKRQIGSAVQDKLPASNNTAKEDVFDIAHAELMLRRLENLATATKAQDATIKAALVEKPPPVGGANPADLTKTFKTSSNQRVSPIDGKAAAQKQKLLNTKELTSTFIKPNPTPYVTYVGDNLSKEQQIINYENSLPWHSTGTMVHNGRTVRNWHNDKAIQTESNRKYTIIRDFILNGKPKAPTNEWYTLNFGELTDEYNEKLKVIEEYEKAHKKAN